MPDPLDFERLRRQVADLCLTDEGQALVAAQGPWADPEALSQAQAEVWSLCGALDRGLSPELSRLPPVAALWERLEPAGSLLEGRDLRDLGLWLDGTARLRTWLAGLNDRLWDSWLSAWPDLGALARALLRWLDADGRLKEDEIPSLRQLAGQAAAARREIDQSARAWLRGQGGAAGSGASTGGGLGPGSADPDLWASDVPTDRGGRTVLALKANFKGRVPALVHESSASGQTLYVEPLELVEKNNRLIEVQEAYRREVLRILRELSAQAREHRHEARMLLATVPAWDALWARARRGQSWAGVFPNLAESGQAWGLRQARHPFLGAAAVPISLGFEAGLRVLLISGPNTGGKTVSLKTLGLAALCQRWALPFPCAPDSSLPWIGRVWADMGDPQDMDRALSTYSGHLAALTEIAAGLEPGDLVLLDELGTGTDPREGGALAQAFLEAFAAAGALVLGTTHHGALKEWALGAPGAGNASVEFDSTEGRPTYRILPGLPGASHALSIAARVGVPAPVVARAQALAAGLESEAERALAAARQAQDRLAAERRDFEAAREAFREEARRTDLLRLRLKQKEKELREAGAAELSRFLSDSRSLFERLLQQGTETRFTKDQIGEARRFFAGVEARLGHEREAVENLEQEVAAAERADSPAEPEGFVWQAGAEVFYESRRGQLLRSAGRERWLVALGAVKMTLPQAKLRPAPPSAAPRVSIETSEVDRSAQPVLTLDLRGFREAAALEALQQQLDRALLKGLHEFSVIHGLGEGILQKAVQTYLRGRPEVKKFYFSHPEEGGFGKTIVQLD